MNVAQAVQRVLFGGPVAGVARAVEGLLVQQGGAAVVAAGTEASAQGGGLVQGVVGPMAGSGVVRGGEQVVRLAVQPGLRLVFAGQGGFGGVRGRWAGSLVGLPRVGQVHRPGAGGRVVVVQPVEGGMPVGFGQVGGQGGGVGGDQVMQGVAAVSGLVEQAGRVQLIQQPRSIAHGGVGEGSQRVGFDCAAGVPGRQPQRLLLVSGEVRLDTASAVLTARCPSESQSTPDPVPSASASSAQMVAGLPVGARRSRAAAIRTASGSRPQRATIRSTVT